MPTKLDAGQPVSRSTMYPRKRVATLSWTDSSSPSAEISRCLCRILRTIRCPCPGLASSHSRASCAPQPTACSPQEREDRQRLRNRAHENGGSLLGARALEVSQQRSPSPTVAFASAAHSKPRNHRRRPDGHSIPVSWPGSRQDSGRIRACNWVPIIPCRRGVGQSNEFRHRVAGRTVLSRGTYFHPNLPRRAAKIDVYVTPTTLVANHVRRSLNDLIAMFLKPFEQVEHRLGEARTLVQSFVPHAHQCTPGGSQ